MAAGTASRSCCRRAAGRRGFRAINTDSPIWVLPLDDHRRHALQNFSFEIHKEEDGRCVDVTGCSLRQRRVPPVVTPDPAVGQAYC